MFQEAALANQQSHEQASMQKGSIEKVEAGKGYKREI